MKDEFSVYQFFPDGTNERVRQFVSAEEAVDASIHYCTSVGAKIGTTTMVRITDGNDFCAFEWTRTEGIRFGVPDRQLGWFKNGVMPTAEK